MKMLPIEKEKMMEPESREKTGLPHRDDNDETKRSMRRQTEVWRIVCGLPIIVFFSYHFYKESHAEEVKMRGRGKVTQQREEEGARGRNLSN